MYEKTIRYLASAFVDASSATFNEVATQAIAKTVDQKSAQFHSVIESNSAQQVPNIRNLITWNQGQAQLVLGSGRFDFFYQPNEQNKFNLGYFADFCAVASKALSKALKLSQRKPHRLAALREGFIPVTDKQRDHDICQRLLKLPKIYQQNIPFEWDWRCASKVTKKVGSKSETVNHIVTVKRQVLTFGVPRLATQTLDGVRIDIDFNTNAEDTRPRFSPTDVTSFFKAAPTWHSAAEAEIMKFILK